MDTAIDVDLVVKLLVARLVVLCGRDAAIAILERVQAAISSLEAVWTATRRPSLQLCSVSRRSANRQGGRTSCPLCWKSCAYAISTMRLKVPRRASATA